MSVKLLLPNAVTALAVAADLRTGDQCVNGTHVARATRPGRPEADAGDVSAVGVVPQPAAGDHPHQLAVAVTHGTAGVTGQQRHVGVDLVVTGRRSRHTGKVPQLMQRRSSAETGEQQSVPVIHGLIGNGQRTNPRRHPHPLRWRAHGNPKRKRGNALRRRASLSLAHASGYGFWPNERFSPPQCAQSKRASECVLWTDKSRVQAGTCENRATAKRANTFGPLCNCLPG